MYITMVQRFLMQLIGLGRLVSFHMLLIYKHTLFHASESVFSKLKSSTMKQLSCFFSQRGSQESAEENLYLLISEKMPWLLDIVPQLMKWTDFSLYVCWECLLCKLILCLHYVLQEQGSFWHMWEIFWPHWCRLLHCLYSCLTEAGMKCLMA